MSDARRAIYLLNAFFLAALLGAHFWRPAPLPHFSGLTEGDIPQRVGAYVADGGAPSAVSPEIRRALNAATLIDRVYSPEPEVATAGQKITVSDPVEFVMIEGTDRSVLHDPRSCFVGDGWEVLDDRSETLPGGNVPVRSCRLRRRAASGNGKVEAGAASAAAPVEYDVLYLYVVDGRVIDRVTDIRAEMLWSALIGKQNRPVYFLRFVRPAYSENDRGSSVARSGRDLSRAEREHQELLQFAGGLWERLSPRLLEPTAPEDRKP